MCSGAALIIGLFLLVKGDFRIANRNIPKNFGRLIGGLLIAPLVVSICVSVLVLPGIMDVTEDISIDTLINSPEYQQVALLELGLLVLALIGVAYLILSRPKSPPNTPPVVPPTYSYGAPSTSAPSNNFPFAGMPKQAPPPMPSVMTVDEAAAYLRVTAADIQGLIDEGKIAAARTASGFRIARRVLDDFLQNGQG